MPWTFRKRKQPPRLEGWEREQKQGNRRGRRVRLTKHGQVVPWHKYPEITFFLGCRELNTFPRKTYTPQSVLGSALGEEPGTEG